MSLPALASPVYKTTLPISKKSVEYRPFLVKEERNLLLAIEEESEEAIIASVFNLLKGCTFEKLDLSTTGVTDVEYLFIQIWMKSNGETMDVLSKCSSCGKTYTHTVDLPSVKVSAEVDDIVNMGDGVFIKFRPPVFSEENITLNTRQEEIAAMVEHITFGDRVYDRNDMTQEEIIVWMDNLTASQSKLIDTYVDNTPFIEYRANATCSHCGEKNEIVLRGLTSFFG